MGEAKRRQGSPSLTPNEDRAREIITATTRANAGRASQHAFVRILEHICNEAMIAQCREYDRGSDTGDVVDGTVCAAGTLLANLAAGLKGSPPETLLALLSQVAHAAFERLPAAVRTEPEFRMEPSNEGHRA